MVKELTPEQQEFKQRLKNIRKRIRFLQYLLWNKYKHKCLILEKEVDKTIIYQTAKCALCDKIFGWYCPKSERLYCRYKPNRQCKYCDLPHDRSLLEDENE